MTTQAEQQARYDELDSSHAARMIRANACALLKMAEDAGFVLTITQLAGQPPSMGHSRGLITVRPSRAAYTRPKV